MKSFKEYLKETSAVSNLTPGQLLQIKPYLKTDADGSQYYDYPDTDPKEVGAIMGTKMTSPAALAQIKSPQGQAEVIKHLLAHTDSANAVNPVTTTTTAMSDADAAAAVPQNEDAELIRWRKIAGLVKEEGVPKITPPPAPPIPAQDGEPNPGEKVATNPDGTRTYSGGFGTFTYDKSGKAIKYSSPNFTGANADVDLASGDQTTNVNQGPMSVSTTQTPGGYTKQSDMQADLGTATLGQKTVGPNIAAGQLAGTTTNTVTNKQTGRAVQQVQGVGFGGASGPNVGKNYVGASTDDLAQHAANSVVGINPDDAATPPQARVAPAVSPTAPKTEKDVVDLNAKYNKKKPAAPSENIDRLRELSGIKEGPQQQPTQQQADKFNTAIDTATQNASNNFSQGNYVKGAMDAAKGVNAALDAADVGFFDKLGMAWMGLKAGARAAWAGRKGDGNAAANAATASLMGEVLPDMHEYVNNPDFEKDFPAGMMQMKNSPEPSHQDLYKKFAAGQLTAKSMKDIINRQYAAYQKMVKDPSKPSELNPNDSMYTSPDQLPQPPQPASEDMARLRELSGIKEKEIEEAPEPTTAPPSGTPSAAPTGPAPKPANPPPMPAAGQDMDLTKIDNDTLFGKHQQLQSTLNFMQPQSNDKQMATSTDPASQNMMKGMQDQLNQAQEELKKRGYTDQQLKPTQAAAKPLDQSDAQFKEDLDAMLRIAKLR